MAIDVFTFFNEVKLITESSVEINPLDHEKENRNSRKDAAQQQKNTDIEEHHINKLRRSLSKLKTEVTDCEKKLGPDEFRFCPSQSGKKDLEVSHKHPNKKNAKHKILKIELKGKKSGGRSEASQYAIPMDQELEVPHYDHEGNPILDDKGIHQTTKFTPRDYLTNNPIPSNIKKCIDNCNDDDQSCIDACHQTTNKQGKTVTKPGRTDVWDPNTKQPGAKPSGWFARVRSLLSISGARQKLREMKKQGLHHTVGKALPALLGSMGTHATISGNDENISVIHHHSAGEEGGRGRHEDRDELEHLFGQMGLSSTHEPHEITSTSGSPHITYPTETRGSHAMLRISHTNKSDKQKELAQKNAQALK